MDIDNIISAFFSDIESTLKNDRTKTINPVSDFSKFLENKSRLGDLDEDYDDFTAEEFKVEASNHRSSLEEYAESNDLPWLNKSNPNRWSLASEEHTTQDTKTSNPEVSSTDQTISSILIKSATNIHDDELDTLRTYTETLKSREVLDTSDTKRIANCVYLIANVSYQVSRTAKNAADWEEAGDWLSKVDLDKAYESYKHASEQYSTLLMYSESAAALKKAISLKEYKSLDKKGQAQRLKDLLDCQVQFDRAGENQHASEMFIQLNDIKVSTKPFYIKPAYYLFKLSSRYGECPLRVLLSAFLVILFTTIIYCIGGIKSGVDPSGLPILEKDILTSLYFSLVTFTTLGYGDYSPIGWVRVAATFQALAGLVLTSLFMVTLVRKYSR